MQFEGAGQGPDVCAAVLNAIADGVVVLDGAGAARLINPAGQRLIEPPPDWEGAPLFEFARDEELLALAARALHGDTDHAAAELILAGRTLRVSAEPLPGAAGGAVLLLHDLTEVRRVERMRQEFVANSSHELLTPIGTVTALVEALASGGIDRRKVAKRFLKQLRREADRLSVLARDLLDLAQIESGEVHLELAPTDAHELAAVVLDRMGPRAKKAHVRLEQHAAATPAIALADAARLEQVLVNLLHNAIKYTPSGGAVSLRVEVTGSEVLWRVEDTGVGIAADDLPRVFERFYKVRQPAANGKKPGTGLGLAIARHLVEAMGGRIWAESQPGQGARFTIALARMPWPAAQEQASEREAALPDLR